MIYSILASIFICAVIFLQSSLPIPNFEAVQIDFAFIGLVYVAHQRGSLVGMVIGLVTGVLYDSMSVAPLGFHILINVSIGYFVGYLKNNMVVPLWSEAIILTGIAIIIKFLLSVVIALLFSIGSIFTLLFSVYYYIEIAILPMIASIIFPLMRRFSIHGSIEKIIT